MMTTSSMNPNNIS
uniref:Uncharacterized protein n=1 Tax=Arundo donax TaxID=35708 RepID=A0A0A8ZJY8_ARUDO